jgi:antitoxin component YwqK of YwqJK toxin-antitoxin module
MHRIALVLIVVATTTSALTAQSRKEKKKEELNSSEVDAPGVALDTTDQFIIDPTTQVPLTVNLEADEEKEEEEKDKKKKKQKKNVYFGLKTKKGFSRKGSGEQAELQLFRYLKNYENPDPYVRDVHWYDTKRKQIRTTHNIDKKKALILHGPYKKITEDGEVLEQGMFYKGTKHGRWTRYNRKEILLDKEKYTRGWPRESEITYYDEDQRAKVKEVIPVEYGEEEGYYFYFHPGGRVAVEGEYQEGKKVGVWTEYYDFEKRAKKQIKYPDDPFDDETKPHIAKEWNPQGQVVYDYKEKTP